MNKATKNSQYQFSRRKIWPHTGQNSFKYQFVLQDKNSFTAKYATKQKNSLTYNCFVLGITYIPMLCKKSV